jgi:hypothetical protein
MKLERYFAFSLLFVLSFAGLQRCKRGLQKPDSQAFKAYVYGVGFAVSVGLMVLAALGAFFTILSPRP